MGIIKTTAQVFGFLLPVLVWTVMTYSVVFDYDATNVLKYKNTEISIEFFEDSIITNEKFEPFLFKPVPSDDPLARKSNFIQGELLYKFLPSAHILYKYYYLNIHCLEMKGLEINSIYRYHSVKGLASLIDENEFIELDKTYNNNIKGKGEHLIFELKIPVTAENIEKVKISIKPNCELIKGSNEWMN